MSPDKVNMPLADKGVFVLDVVDEVIQLKSTDSWPFCAKPLTLPPTVCVVVDGLFAQLTPTLLTLLVPMVPVPFDTVQVWPAGCVLTVML